MPVRRRSFSSREAIEEPSSEEPVGEKVHVMGLLVGDQLDAVLLQAALESVNVCAWHGHGGGQYGHLVPRAFKECAGASYGGCSMSVSYRDLGVQLVTGCLRILAHSGTVEHPLAGPLH